MTGQAGVEDACLLAKEEVALPQTTMAQTTPGGAGSTAVGLIVEEDVVSAALAIVAINAKSVKN